MNLNKTVIAAAVLSVTGTSALMSTAASAATIGGETVTGSWALTIKTTDIKTTAYGATAFKIGKDGAYSSSFSFGQLPGNTSNGMTDNDTTVDNPTPQGSGIADGVAGDIGLDITGNTFTVPGTSITGTLSDGGDLVLTPTGRFGHIDAPFLNAEWNIDNFTVPSATTWNTLSTGSATASLGTINGAVLANIGDVDGDLIDDFGGILVGGGQVGSVWGSFFGATYFETWNVELLSGGGASGFNVDTIFGTAGGNFAQSVASTSAVPVPAAVWLFGSGLMGLVGVARRKKV